MAKLKAQGKVLKAYVNHKDSSGTGGSQGAAAREEAVIEFSIQTPSPIIEEENGLGRKVRDTISNSFSGLTWSIEKLFVGICLAGPWVALGTLGWFLHRVYRRRRAAREAARSVTTP